MTKLVWGEAGSRLFEAGVDRGVLFPHDSVGIAWNGLISVKEAPSGTIERKNYVDGLKYRNQQFGSSFAATIEAFTYPAEFEPYDGFSDGWGSQLRTSFNFSYRTKIGSDLVGLEHGYKIHLVYNALATPAQRDNTTIGDSVDAGTFVWNISTTPRDIPGFKPSSHLVIDSTKAHAWTLEAFEEVLYGTTDTAPMLPSPEEVLELFESNAIVRIIDHGDGTWSAIGPDEYVHFLDATSFEINYETAVYIDTESYTVTSL